MADNFYYFNIFSIQIIELKIVQIIEKFYFFLAIF
jgi:hypothetical protein